MTEAIRVGESLELHAAAESHVMSPYQLTRRNRTQLQRSLSWSQFIQGEEDTRKAVQGNVILHQREYAKMFMTLEEDGLIGIISFSYTEPLNRTAEVGYWLDKSHREQGIIFQALQTSIHHYARSGELRRFVIECRAGNVQGSQVVLRNSFILEGCLKQAEFLNDAYNDVSLYARTIDSQRPRQWRSNNVPPAINDLWAVDTNRVTIEDSDDGAVGQLHMVSNYYRTSNTAFTLYDNVLIEQNRSAIYRGISTSQDVAF